ncbi:hypothetical protein JTE90_019991 [Oedothorax gibbosus]|uniref:T-complex protein 11-like protein 1 n=1 Tax=Oedothorax gibbosus TaxID=931172 RepID=A0AAV6U392_9ARAC|nr:hypothetical protein JTE90_019991 [Oedothorax gibbosus]
MSQVKIEKLFISRMDDERDKETGESSNQPPNREGSQPRDIPSGSQSRNFPDLGAAAMFPSGVAASPPTFISLEQILKAAEDVSKSGFNMALAHEIAVNKDFKLQQNKPKTGLEGKISEICHQAFWDILTQELTGDPPVYTQAMVLLQEIKDILLWLLLPHNTRLKNEINEVLDIDLIRQQAENEALDFLKCAQFILCTMARICAPARDDNVQELRQLTQVIPLYKGILETLELMKIDMVNFTISRLRPHLQQHSIEYEQKKFKEILQSLESLSPPVDGLKFTRLWLQNVYDEISAEEGRSEEPQNSVVIRRAYLKILRWTAPENFPETLHLDHARFITLGDDLTVMILTATVILVTYSNVGPAIQGITDFKNTLKSHVQILLSDAPQIKGKQLEEKLEAVGLQVAKEVNECLETHGYSALGMDQESTLVALIKKISDEDHTVYQLITKRVLEFLELALGTTSSLKIPPGLSSLQNELSVFAGQFLSLIRHNLSVFSEYYNQIIDTRKSFK